MHNYDIDDDKFEGKSSYPFANGFKT